MTRLLPCEDPARRGLDSDVQVVTMPNPYEYLPEALWPFTIGGDYDPLRPQESLKDGAVYDQKEYELIQAFDFT